MLLHCEGAADALDALLPPPGAERPRIVLSSPAPGQISIPIAAEIFVEFDREMDREATRSAFSLSGAVPPAGQPLWEGRRLYYDLSEALIPGGDYVLRVSGNARSASGALMEVEHLSFFRAGGDIEAPRIVSHSPLRGAQGVDTEAILAMRFSEAMERTSVEQSFSVSPAAAGAFEWDADQAGFRYRPFAPLNNGGAYSVRLLSDAHSASGAALAESYSWSFQVGADLLRPQFLGVRENGAVLDLTDGAAGVRKDSAFALRFSEAMDHAATENAVRILRVADGSAVAADASWTADFENLTVAPREALEPLEQYRLIVSESARDIAGNALLSGAAIVFRVDNSSGAVNSEYLQIINASKHVPAPVEVFNLTPDTVQLLSADDCAATPAAAQLTIDFSHSLDPASLAEHVSFQRLFGPSGAGAALTGLSIESTGVMPRDRLRVYLSDVCDSLYTLKVYGGRTGIRSASAVGESGAWLREDRTFYFRFAP